MPVDATDKLINEYARKAFSGLANPDQNARDAARYRHLRKRGLVWADAAFMDGANEGYIGHRKVGGELADAFCDFDMKRHEGR